MRHCPTVPLVPFPDNLPRTVQARRPPPEIRTTSTLKGEDRFVSPENSCREQIHDGSRRRFKHCRYQTPLTPSCYESRGGASRGSSRSNKARQRGRSGWVIMYGLRPRVPLSLCQGAAKSPPGQGDRRCEFKLEIIIIPLSTPWRGRAGAGVPRRAQGQGAPSSNSQRARAVERGSRVVSRLLAWPDRVPRIPRRTKPRERQPPAASPGRPRG